jgi:hypothetical protein
MATVGVQSSGSGGGGGGGGTGISAYPASAFLNSLGVNVHTQLASVSTIESQLNYLGVRFIRSGEDTSSASSMLSICQATGIKAVYGPGSGWSGTTSSLQNDLSANYKPMATAGCLLAVEGANEPINFSGTYNGASYGGGGSYTPVAQMQADLYAWVHANLAGVPVFNWTHVGAQSPNTGSQYPQEPSGIGSAPAGTPFWDFANEHTYYNDSGVNYAANAAWQCADPAASTNCEESFYGHYVKSYKNGYAGPSNFATLPHVSTELGYENTISGGSAAQGKYSLNTWLSNFKRFAPISGGVTYTAIYDLCNSYGQTFGQYTSCSSTSPSTAATYEHNFTTILADSNSAFTPGALPYSVPIESSDSSVHDLLLQKSNGHFELIVWRDQPNGTGSESLTINFGQSFANVIQYDPTVGATGTSQSAGSSLSTSLSDHAIVVELY